MNDTQSAVPADGRDLPSAGTGAADIIPVAIVGGGPTGLTAALLLARAGIACTVIESRLPAAVAADPRLLALSRGTMQVVAPLLAVAGLAPLRGADIVRVRVSSAGEFGSTTLHAREFGGTSLGTTVRFGTLVTALDAAAARTAGITLLRPVRVVRIEQRPDHARVVLDDGRTVAARVVVRAEGSGPASGAAGATPASGASDDGTPWAIVADVRFAPGRGPTPGDAIERFTREGPFALLPAPEAADTWSIVWCMHGAHVAARMALDDAAFLAGIGERLGARGAAPVAAGPRVAHPLRRHALRRLRDHRVVHVGNAAQTLHPVAGQGFNLGVRDCVVLVAQLAETHALDPLLATAHEVPAGARADDAANAGVSRSRGAVFDRALDALARHDAARRADRTTIRLVTRMLPDLFASPFAPLASARSLGLLALDTLPPARRMLGHLLMFGVRG